MLDFEGDVRYGLIQGVSKFLKTIVDFDAVLLYKFNVCIDLPLILGHAEVVELSHLAVR